MKKQTGQEGCKRQRGIALLVVCFALLLLSVIGLGMMYSTNMETTINANYRDKQAALYAALAGLQEARDRIRYPYSITPPTQLPSTAAANVIYIVADYATVRPWDSGYGYYDTELCQENVLGLIGTPGIPCTTIASGTTWLQYFDDSQSSSAPWNLANPLDLKWARIELKGNNMTPVPVNGDPTSAAETCWNGVNQISTPTSYTTGCKPRGGVTAITVLTSGSRYTSTPTVTITGAGGTGATATAVMAPEQTGYVASIAVTTGGAFYTSPPAVTIIDAAGTGATATAVLATTGVTSTNPGTVSVITLTTGGTGYTTPPTVTISGGGGGGASATAVLSSTGVMAMTGFVSSITLTTGGTAYTSAPTVGFSGGGGGSGAAATAVLSPAGGVNSIAVNSVGTQCYSQASDVQITFSGGGGLGAAATATLESNRSCIYSATVTSSPQCTNKLLSPTYPLTDQASGLTLADVGNKSFSGTLYVSSANDKTPTSVSVQNPGYDSTGYSASAFTSRLGLSGGPWSDCGNIQVTATTGYRLASINLTSPGSGYTSVPAITITGGAGSTSNPTATAALAYPVASVTLTSGGSGYSSTPTVSFSGGGGTGAAATDTIVTTSTMTYSVASVTITAGGTGYTTSPAVSFGGGGGSGAAAFATIAQATVTTYPVASVIVNNGGSGYSSASPPTVTFSGGGGIGAAATATVSNMSSGTYFVSGFTIDTQGSGYTTNPTVTLSGGSPVTPATAKAQISGGAMFGQVYLLTSFAQTKSGARSMLQQEVTTPVIGFAPGGALTLDGPNPVMDAMPNSVNFYIRGQDANTCSESADPDHPAIDGFDDPDANPPTASVQTIKNSLPRPDHYLGAGGTPSVQNGYESLGETMGTPQGLSSYMTAIYNAAPPSSRYTNATVGSFNPNTTNRNSITYVDGDLTLNGNGTGSGILVVTGTLTMSGNFTWYGTVFVVGQGDMQFNGGGNGQILGMLWDAKIRDSSGNLLNTMGSPTFGWNGGGVNSVQFDHCLSTNLLTAIPFTPTPSTKPLKVLSFRILPY